MAYPQIFLLLLILICITNAVRKEDLVPEPPGMKNVVVYSGYLNTEQNDRKLHYIFVQADIDSEKAPLTIWLDGGPGCSSLVGFIQYLGPYIVGNKY